MQVSQKLNWCFNELGITPDLASFSERKRLQKLTYLIEAWGIDLGFSFSWYLHGPYSPQLTKVLYNADQSESVRDVLDKENDKQIIKSLKDFLGSDVKSSNTLELIVSLLYLMLSTKRVGEPLESALKSLRKLKPFFTPEETEYYYKKLAPLV